MTHEWRFASAMTREYRIDYCMPKGSQQSAVSDGAPTRGAVRKIALVGFNGCQLLDIAGPLEVFAKANLHMPEVAATPFKYELIIASPSGGAITSSSGMEIAGTRAIADLDEELDTLMIAGGPEDALREVATTTDLLKWIASRAPRTRRMASICTGAFLLGSCGLLDGRRATTHWSATKALGNLLTKTEVVPDAIFVGDGHIFTSAGVTAGIDLTLAFVEQDCGPQVALTTARDLVLYLRRAGGQSQFSTSLAAQANAANGLQPIINWIQDRPNSDLSVPVLAERAAMSGRTFARAFLAETGMTPAKYVELVRLDRAKQLLETTKWPLARVADRSGLGSAATLARIFRRHLGITPEDYRERFRLRPVGSLEHSARADN
jgi:transcriptional regulator GlxA family with amidase domain